MRIAHIDTERTWRGGEQQALSLMNGLKANGHFILAIARRGSEFARRARPSHEVMEIRTFGEFDFIAAHFVNRRIRREKIDVVHAHTAHAVSLAAIATLGTSIPVVATRRVDFHLAMNPFSRWKYNRMARIVAISEGVKRILLQDGIAETKVPVVPSGVDFTRFNDVRPISKIDFGFPAGSIIVGQVAALAPHKDQNNLLEAAARIKRQRPEVKFVVVGEGELRPELERTIKDLGLTDTVRLLGFRDRPLDYLAAFDVFCLSSKEEGLGTSIIDAMVLKKPVVATRVGGIPELVEDRVTGFLAPGSDPDDLARAIISCLSASASEREAMLGKAAQKAQNFDVIHTIRRMEAIYAGLSTELST